MYVVIIFQSPEVANDKPVFKIFVTVLVIIAGGQEIRSFLSLKYFKFKDIFEGLLSYVA